MFLFLVLGLETVSTSSLLYDDIPASWPERTRVLAKSVLQEANLVLNNKSAHPFPNHLADAALGLLLSTNGSSQIAIQQSSEIFEYMFIMV